MPPDPFGSSDCGAAAIAQLNFTDLAADAPFDLPPVDLTGSGYQLPAQTGPLYTDPTQLTNADLTTGVIGGSGTFDVIMASTHAHLKGEFDKQRITGDQYAKAYIELTTAALGTASQFLLGRDQAYWAALLTQSQARAAEIQAVIAAVQLETAKAQLQIAYYEANKSEADYALTKMKIATEDATFCGMIAQTEIARYTLDNMLPEQLLGLAQDTISKTYNNVSILPAQLDGMQADTVIKDYQVATFLPAQVAGILTDNQMKTYQFTSFMPVQLDGIIAETAMKEFQINEMLPKQMELISEQVEVQRAQTMDTRTDGITTVVGSVGKQKDLYDQQIDSYVKDAQYKVAKMFLDSWISRLTINDSILVPNQFSEVEIDEIMVLLRANNSLGS